VCRPHREEKLPFGTGIALQGGLPELRRGLRADMVCLRIACHGDHAPRVQKLMKAIYPL